MEKSEIYGTCFKLKLQEKNDIFLEKAYPINDEEGKILIPYSFTIQNICDSASHYQINLEVLNTTTFEDLSYMKIMLDDNISLLTENEETEKTLDDATKSYKLKSGYLDILEEKTFTLRLWMDENTPTEKSYMNKILESKIIIINNYLDNLENNIEITPVSKNTKYGSSETFEIKARSEKFPIVAISEDKTSWEEIESKEKEVILERTYEKNGNYKIYFKDELEHIEEQTIKVTKIDDRSPIANMKVMNESGKIKIDASTSKDNETSINKYYYSKDGINFEESSESTYEYSIFNYGLATTTIKDLKDSSMKKIFLKVEDEVGNISDVKEYSIAIDNSDLFYDETADNNLRYVGANPNNYVRFNNELWRIIGVMNNIDDGTGKIETRIKLVRKDSLGNYAWDNHGQYGSNDWTNSLLMTILNHGAYWNKTSGNCPSGGNGATVSCNFTSNGLNATAKEMIGNTLWNFGGSNTWEDVTTSMLYSRERDKIVYTGRKEVWRGKISLIYPSDYGYATRGNSITTREICLTKNLYNWDKFSDCYNNDWLYKNGVNQWTITPHAAGGFDVFYINSVGSALIYGFRSNTSHQYAVFPSLYLKSTVKITSGNGSQSEPFNFSL